MIRPTALLSLLVLGALAASARAENDIVVDRHQAWETQARNYCGPNPISMRPVTTQAISEARCVADFHTGEVRFHPYGGRTMAEWPIRGRVTQAIIGYCRCVVHD